MGLSLLCLIQSVTMETNICMLMLALTCLSGSLEAVLWNKKNCNPNGDDVTVVRGRVTDAICCGEEYTKARCYGHSKNSCNAKDECRWHDPKATNIKCKLFGVLLPECRKSGSCKANRDKANNVCCKNPDLDKLDNCVDLMSGRCPKAWQVPRDCCPAPNDKYANMLTCDSKRSDLICCNAPCTAIEQAWRGSEGNLTAGIHPVPGRSQCTADGSQMPMAVKENCAPGKRSFLSGLMGGGAGLDPSLLSQLMGMPVGESIDLGKVIPGMAGGTGLDGGATLAALQGLGFGASKNDHVDEITVDDFFDSIIEALDNDKDVFEYNKEINSDSWFGKQSFGGLVDGFNFIDPKKFINRIYGSPFGLANAQSMFGMQYGIPMNKFKKHTGFHQIMTGYSNPYGPPPPSPHATQPPSYHPPTPSTYDPQPPSYHPPTPPPYTPPVYPGPIPEHHPENVAEPVPYPQPQPYPDQSTQHYPEPYPQPYPQPEHQQPVYEPYPEQQPYNPHPYPPQPEQVPHQPEPAHYQPYPEQAPVNYPAYPEPSHDPYYPAQPPADPYYPAHDPYYPAEPAQPPADPYYPAQPQPDPYYPAQPPHDPYYPAQPPYYPAQPQQDPYYPPQPSYPQQDPYYPPHQPQQHYPEQVPYPPQNQYGYNPNPVPGYGHVPAHGHGGPPPPSAAVHGPPATPPTAATAAPALDPTDNDPTV